MIDKDLILTEIRRAPIANRYNHLISALDVVLSDSSGTEARKDATAIVRLHIQVNKQMMMDTAKMEYTV